MDADAAGGKAWYRMLEPLVRGTVESKSVSLAKQTVDALQDSPWGSASLTMISVPVIGSLTRR